MENNLMELSLTDIFNEAGGDKGSYFTHVGSTENISHNYTRVYDEIMSPFRNGKISLMEIGLWCPFFPGASVKAWSKYFTNADYYGVDIVDCRHLSSNRSFIDIMDQKSEQMINEYLRDKPKFKFIIDDGCHEEDAIVISLGNLFSQLESGGVYFIEDLHVVDKTDLYKLVDKKFTSRFISQDKIDYINNNIDRCYFDCNDKMCVIYKK